MRIIKRFIAILIVILLVFLGMACGVRRAFPRMYLDSLERYTKECQMDPLLVLSIMKTESNFDARAVSSKGARGLMQIMDPTAQWISSKLNISNYTPDLLYDPDFNIKIGVWYLRWLYDKYHDIDLVIVAYNGGVGNVDKWLTDKNYSNDGRSLTNIPFEETSNYLLKVKFTYKMYKFLYE